jgi:DNA polymerase III sliding clamp (beta) subunit (PCNA family)
VTSITFETATIADAVRKAALVAPTTRGEAWDMAHGVMFHLDPTAEHALTLRATNLAMFHTEWVTALHAEGKTSVWRLPSVQLAAVVTRLPIGSGRTVTMEEKDGKIIITSGKNFKCQLNMPASRDYPNWSIFDPDDLSAISGLGKRIKLVEWAAAASNANMAMTGVRLDGEVALATDTFRAAMAPCPVDHLEAPVTVPTGTLSAILKDEQTAKMGNNKDNLLFVMPDDWTQVQIRTIGVEWPTKVKAALQPIVVDTVEVDRDELLGMIQRAWALDQANRTPIISMYFGKGEVACVMQSDEIGLLRDVIEVENQADHRRIQYMFNPKNMIETLNSMPGKKVTIGYSQPSLGRMIYVSGGDGYEAWVARTQPPKKGADSS